jgi:TRAP transporter TAXI family solute receptor
MAGQADAARKCVRFGGSNPGGSWFVIVGGLSACLSGQLKDLNVTAIATGGSVDNNRLARKGELDTWLTHSLTAYDNWNGVGIFKDKKPFTSIRLLCGVCENHHHFVVLPDSKVKKMADLAGKKYAWDRPAAAGR